MSADDVIRILDELGQRIGPAGSHVFELAVRQAIISSAIWGLLSLIVAILTGIGLVGVIRWAMHNTNDDDADFLVIIGGTVCIVGLIGASLMFLSSLIILLNPEFEGLKTILYSLKR